MDVLTRLAEATTTWTAKDWTTLGLAALGSGLGIINLGRDVFKTRRQNRVVLRIRPSIGLLSIRDKVLHAQRKWTAELGRIMTVAAPRFVVVEVVNESSFPVWISKMGVRFSVPNLDIAYPMEYETYPVGEWPRKLERKQAVTVMLRGINYEKLLGLGARAVSVETSDGKRFEKSSHALRGLRREYKSLPKDDLGLGDISKRIDGKRDDSGPVRVGKDRHIAE